MRGKFITLEGGEGVGKTTNKAHIENWLTQKGIDYIATREPGGTPLAEQIRDLLLCHHDEALAPMAELLLIFAARAQHISRLVEPALQRGTWVLCDRFTDATYAYQGAGRALGMDKVACLESLVQGELRPDLTLLLDIAPDQGLSRASRRGDQLDRFEVEESAFFDRVRMAYLQLAEADPARYRVIDASQPLAAVQQDITTVLEAL